jgi:hypothetical protein
MMVNKELKIQKKPNSVWVSCFWAKYNILPEPFKKGFYDLAQSIAERSAEQGTESDTGLAEHQNE